MTLIPYMTQEHKSSTKRSTAVSRLNHRPRKRFGQHFLHDPDVIGRIVTAIAPQPSDYILEIGPGLGALTRPLLDRCQKLDVVELDRDLAAALRKTDWTREGRLTVHENDALRFDYAALADSNSRLRIVGNLPYNISTPLLFHLLDQADAIRDIHVMLQKEVVERLAAKPGNASYGRLSIMVQYRCVVEKLFVIGPGAFRPPPKVESAVVKLSPRKQPAVRIDDEKIFEQVVRRAFAQRRKTLRNALKEFLDAAEIRAAGIDPGARPGVLGLEDYSALSNAVARIRAADN